MTFTVNGFLLMYRSHHEHASWRVLQSVRYRDWLEYNGINTWIDSNMVRDSHEARMNLVGQHNFVSRFMFQVLILPLGARPADFL
jgi:hypothetical protein